MPKNKTDNKSELLFILLEFFVWTLFVKTFGACLGQKSHADIVMFDHGGIGRASALLELVTPSH